MAVKGGEEDSASPQPRTSRHGSSGDDDSGASRSRRSRDSDRDHDRRHRDRESKRRRDDDGYDRRRDRRDRDDDDYDRRRNRRDRDDDDYDRRRDRRGREDDEGYDRRRNRRDDDGYDRRRYRRDGEDRHRSKSRSPEKRRSRSKSQRISGFDMAPPNLLPITGIGQLPLPPAIPVQATRHARRIYVGGIPPTANEQIVADFFSNVMALIGGNTAGPGNTVINVYINHDKKMAFVEMRSVEEASNAMALNGVLFDGAPVKVKRPSDYNLAMAAPLGPSEPNPKLNLAAVGLTAGSGGVLDGPDRIFIGGLPYTVTEAEIRELLEKPFGPLKGLDLIKDKETGTSKGYAFCAFQDPSHTDAACAALNGFQITHNRTLKVNRASQGASPPKDHESLLSQAHQHVAMQKLLMTIPIGSSKVVCLTNALNPDDLKDDEEYEDIVEDMENECRKFGSLVRAVIPRPGCGGVGKVFLEYGDVQSAGIARQALHGRRFDGNPVVAVFYPDDKFSQGDYTG